MAGHREDGTVSYGDGNALPPVTAVSQRQRMVPGDGDGGETGDEQKSQGNGKTTFCHTLVLRPTDVASKMGMAGPNGTGIVLVIPLPSG